MSDLSGPPPPDAGLLAQITAELAGGGAPADLLRRFLAPVMQVCGAEAGAMRVLSADGACFELVGERGLPARVRAAEQSVDSGCGACGSAALTLDLAWTDELAPCMRKRSDGGFFGDAGRRMLAVPLQHRGQVLGLCNLFFAREAVVAPQVCALLKTMGELLGLALHGARLERENLAAAVQAERQQMGAEVHDAIAQTLAFAKMRLPLLEAAIETGDQAAAQRCCSDLRRAVGEAHAGLREVLSHASCPADPEGFRHALQTSKLRLRQTAAVELAVDDRAPGLRLSPAQEHQVQRIVQEALHNIARHAHARHAWLRIEHRQGKVQILVDDDGAGMAPTPGDDEAHFGLGIMRQRAALLGGKIQFARRRQGGTRVRLHFPVAGRAGA